LPFLLNNYKKNNAIKWLFEPNPIYLQLEIRP
jgi:hypothetical protein